MSDEEINLMFFPFFKICFKIYFSLQLTYNVILAPGVRHSYWTLI